MAFLQFVAFLSITNFKTTGGQIFLSDLQRYFSGLGNAPPEGEGAVGGTGASRVELGAALATPEVVSTASEPANSQRLAPHLPPAPPAAPQDDVRTTLLSPQFAQVNPQVLRHRCPRHKFSSLHYIRSFSYFSLMNLFP